MRILAIGAHPDDVEFGCAPLLIQEVRNGNEVKILVLSLGEAGTSGTPTERKQESITAAKIMGASIEFLDFGGDCHITYSPTNAFTLARTIRDYQPQIVLAPQVDENQHPDHSVAGKLTRDAARFARYGGLAELTDLPVHSIDNLYYYFITQPFTQQPDIVIDVSSMADQWKQVMEAHSSQMQSKQYLELILARARSLGSAIGTDYAVGLWTNEPIRLQNVSAIRLSARNY